MHYISTPSCASRIQRELYAVLVGGRLGRSNEDCASLTNDANWLAVTRHALYASIRNELMVQKRKPPHFHYLSDAHESNRLVFKRLET